MSAPRLAAILVAILSGAAMLYVGLYQSRVIKHMVCPINGEGCHRVADAPFARPFGVPDGYIGAALYGLIVLLLVAPSGREWTWYALIGLAAFATFANVVGVFDMMKLGAFCFYCLLTTLLSPVLIWSVWVSR